MPSRPLIGGTGLSGRVGLCPATIIVDVELRPKSGKARWGQLTRSHGGHPGCAADREPFEPPTDTRSVMRATVGVSVGRVAV